jgi:acyl-CoA dehydrogenase
MAWDFETEPDFQAKLDWMDRFVREEVEPLDLAFRESGAPYDRKNPVYRKVTAPLMAEVRKQGLWACHLGPELAASATGS